MMARMTSAYLRLREGGQGMVEYVLILVLIAVVVIAVLMIVGNQVHNVFYNLTHTRGLNPCLTTDQQGNCQ
jgi:pilus assembly protein Flp/PilA